MILSYSNNKNMSQVMGMNFEMKQQEDGKTRFQVVGAENIHFSSLVKDSYVIGDSLRVETEHSVYMFDLLPHEKKQLTSPKQLYYLFETNDLSLVDAVAAVGRGVYDGSISLIGPAYEIKEEQGKILMYVNSNLVYAPKYEYKISYDGEASGSPKKLTTYGNVGASNMKVYRNKGARYMFVPVSAKLLVTL